jgi:hypothetical protein
MPGPPAYAGWHRRSRTTGSAGPPRQPRQRQAQRQLGRRRRVERPHPAGPVVPQAGELEADGVAGAEHHRRVERLAGGAERRGDDGGQGARARAPEDPEGEAVEEQRASAQEVKKAERASAMFLYKESETPSEWAASWSSRIAWKQ